MLVLSRKAGECIFVGDDIVIQVLNIGYRHVQLGLHAPESIPILRDDAKKKTPDRKGQVNPPQTSGQGKENEL